MIPSVRVGPFTYKVSLVREMDNFGETNRRTHHILLAKDQAPGAMQDTVLHETLHAVLHLVGLAQEWGGETEEAVISRMTPALLGVLRSNPKLVEYLTA